MTRITRRAVLAAGAGAFAACRRRKGSGYAGFVFVANQEGSNVAVVDLLTFAVTRRIPVEGAPSAVLAHPQGRAVYILSPERGLIHEIDAAGLTLRRTARLGAPAGSIRMSPCGDALWVLSRGPNALMRVPLDTLRPATAVRLPKPAGEFDLSQDGIAAVTFPGEQRLGLAGPGANAIEAMLPAPGDPLPLCFRRGDREGRQIIAGNRLSRSISIWDVRTRHMIVDLPVPMQPAHFCFNSNNGQLFVSGPGIDAVTILYPYQTEVAETILAGKGPESMAASATPPYLFVSNPQSATVTVLDVDTRRLVAVAGVGADPGQILFTPDGEYALVLNRGSGDLAVMRINSLRTGADGIPRNDPRRKNPSPLFALVPVGSRPVSAAVVPA